MVLIKNEGLLPLALGRSVALIGPGVASTALLGGGSALLEPHAHTSVLEAFTARWSGVVRHVAGVELRRSADTVPADWIGTDGVTVELFGERDFAGEPFASERRTRADNVWWDHDYPAGHDAVSVRVRLTLVPQASGLHRLVGAGYGCARLYVDGALVADSDTDGFPAGFGFLAAAVELELEVGRTVEVMLEAVQPEDNTYPAAMVDVGVATVDLSVGLDEAASAAAAADVVVVVVGSNANGSPRAAIAATWSCPPGRASWCDGSPPRTRTPSSC